MRPTTVCYMLTRLEAGGAERQLVLLLAGLDRSRFRPLVVVEKLGGALETAVRELAIPIHVVGRRVRWDPLFPLRLAGLFRRERVRVTHPFDPMFAFYSVLAGVLARVPVRLVTWRNRRYPLLHTVLLQLVMPLTSRLVANSEHAARRIRRWFPFRSRIIAIPNGLDATVYARRPDLDKKRHDLGLASDDRPVVGMVAHLWRQKDHATLFHAVQDLIERWPRLILLLVGDGPERAALEALAARVLPTGRYRFLGKRSDTAELYHLFDVPVLSTHYEGMPNVVMEAMAAGRPVVATAVDGCAELIEHGVTGLLVPPRDAKALAEAIGRVLDDATLAERLGHAGQQHMRKRYSTERLVERHELLYEKLLAKTQAAGEPR